MIDKILQEFDEKFPEGSLGHKHDGGCEWGCSLRPRIHTFLTKAIEQAVAEERKAWLSGERCVECGEENNNDLSSTCENCFENN